MQHYANFVIIKTPEGIEQKYNKPKSLHKIIVLYLLTQLKNMEKYLFLTIKDKKALIKLAESKQLSLSTTAGIIINWLAPMVDNMYTDYINRGEKMIHIKIRPKEHVKLLKLTSVTATNCIYCYFNRPLWKGKKINWQTNYIQSELDRTEDPNRYKNIEMRIKYRLEKGART